MLSKVFRRTLVPAGILSSLIVGAGVFSLPYIFVRAGTVYGLLCLILFVLVMATTHSRYAEIIDKDGKDKRFIGYAEKHLGSRGRIAGLIFVVGGITFALAVYLSLAPSFFSLIFPSSMGMIAALLFWAIGSVMVFFGVKKAASAGTMLFIAMAAIILVLGGFSLIGGKTPDISSMSLFDPLNLILPFGPILFSLSGRSALSFIRDSYDDKDYSLKIFKKAIWIGTAVPAVLYIFFIYATISLSSSGVTPDAISGLAGVPFGILATVGVLGLLATLTSYIFLGMEYVGILTKDVKVPYLPACLILGVAPLAIYFFGTSDFIRLVGVTGGVFLAAESIMVVIMGQRLFGRRFADFFLIAVFAVGMAYELLGFLR